MVGIECDRQLVDLLAFSQRQSFLEILEQGLVSYLDLVV